MNAREANVLLTQISVIDGRIKRTPEEQAEVAKAWAGILADVPLSAALDAVNAHYSVEERSVMPANIRGFMEASWLGSSDAGNITEQRLAREMKAVTQ